MKQSGDESFLIQKENRESCKFIKTHGLLSLLYSEKGL